jgi:hypothetical protein
MIIPRSLKPYHKQRHRAVLLQSSNIMKIVINDFTECDSKETIVKIEKEN